MSSRIKVLPEDLINKIAAGEVVERPASVAKELIENSIDAGATRIRVEVQDAGRKLIRVSDNGQGMSQAEAKLALERHSTSKISQLDDLFNIQTLGFRGEALPSIASVSKMELEPNPSGSGITATVKELFWNTPARKKFLKSPATEMGHIGNIVAKYTMANPQIAFDLISDGKPLLSSPGSGDLKDAVIAVYGVDLAKSLIETSFNSKFGKVYGLISQPTLSRVDKTYENFFVNKRFVRNFLLNRALEEAYRTLIPSNRYPVAILFIDIDPKQIDVNVHPTKREIKFVKTNEVMNAVTQAAREALAGTGSVGLGREVGIEVGSEWWGMGKTDPFPTPHAQTHIPTPLPTSSFTEVEMEVSAVQPFLPIYQHKQTYIIATDGEELVLIDQHAAHERILYDQLSHESRVAGRQSLLIPETIELGPKETAILQENIEYLKGLGFDLEEFGNNAYILRSVPPVAAKASAKQLLIDLLSELQDLGKAVQLEIKQENIRKLIACHSAIKAGDKLTSEEMYQLIRDLFSTKNPATCPHGRPTIIRISEEELNKRFGR
ncbi:DNA mismatch repair endonuclease MutL [Candidatus Margulisiibacteriota bacterium]